jgi:hypothetical protein
MEHGVPSGTATTVKEIPTSYPSFLEDQYYSGPVKCPICQSGDLRIFCTGTYVHAFGKVKVNGIFLKNTAIPAESNLQNSGLPAAPFFRP